MGQKATRWSSSTMPIFGLRFDGPTGTVTE